MFKGELDGFQWIFAPIKGSGWRKKWYDIITMRILNRLQMDFFSSQLSIPTPICTQTTESGIVLYIVLHYYGSKCIRGPAQFWENGAIYSAVVTILAAVMPYPEKPIFGISCAFIGAITQ